MIIRKSLILRSSMTHSATEISKEFITRRKKIMMAEPQSTAAVLPIKAVDFD